MKLVSAVLLGILLCIFSAYPAEVTRMIAKVNNEIITSRDLDGYCLSLAYQSPGEINADACKNKEFRRKILRRLIEDRLILSKAKKATFEVPRYMIEERFDQMIAAYPSREKFEASLTERGLNVTLLKEKIKDQYLMRLIIEQQVKSFVSVSPQEISRYYEDNPDKFHSVSRYIFYIAKAEERGTLEEVGATIKEKGIIEAQDIHEDMLIRIESSKGELKEEVSAVIEKIEKGNFGIEKEEDLFYLIYIHDVIEPQLVSLDEAKDKIFSYLWSEKFQKRFNEWIAELKEDAVIEIYYE